MPLSRLSIKYQLFLIVAIIALPAIAIIINSGIRQQEAAIHEAKLETQKFAETIVNEQKNLVASTRQLFIALSQLPEIANRQDAEVQSILSEILRLSPQYSNIFIAEPSGRVWVSAVPLTKVISVADRRYFINAMASGRLSSGEYHIARTTNKPTFNLGYPLTDSTGRVTAVICAGLSLDYYRTVFESYKLPQGASFALLDHAGIILTRAIDPEKYRGKASNPEILKYMQEGPEEETSIGKSSVVGDDRIQTYRKLRLEGETEPYMYIRAGIPAAVVMATTNANLIRNLTIYSAFLVLAFLLSWFIGKRFILDRVLALQRSSQRLADGDLDARVGNTVMGGEIGDLGLAFDHMAEKLAARDQALSESEKNYRDIFDTTHDALFVNDAVGNITEANRSAELMFGYTHAELLQMSVEDLISGAPPYTLTEALTRIEKVLQEGTQSFEWLCRRENGELFWSEITVSPTRSAEERRVLAVIRDITERKEMEDMKELMLSSISHEMRTPLTAMLGFLEFVIENEVDESQLKEYHQIMHKEGERLHEMITNYLDMQRLKAKMHEYRFKPLSVRPLLEAAVAIHAAPSSKYSIVVHASDDLPAIAGDEDLLHQVLSNLLSNAIKYSPEGSEVTLDARLDGEAVTISVQDQGVGIPPEAQARIFDMFFRVEGATRRQVTGTGLGLALVKEIAAVHHGQVWVESALGEGSTFYLAIPVFKSGPVCQV